MIVEIFAYGVIVALLAGLSAMCVERVLVEMRRPRRFAWLGAYAAALVLPLLAQLWADGASAPAEGELRIAAANALSAQIDWNAALPWLWVAATTLLLILYVAAWGRLAWIARRWQRGHADGTDILVAEDVGPAVLGFLRPRVVLPRWLMDAPVPLRNTVVAHELEHIAARDQAVIVAAQVVAILLPWNLPLWWFAKRLRTAIEIDCDARVLRNGVDPAHYADMLLAVVQRGMPSTYVAATLIEPVTQLERRIRIMLMHRPRSMTRAATAAVLAAAVAACATQIEPPVVTTGMASSGAIAAAPPQITAEGPVRVTADEARTGGLTLRAPRIFVTLTNSALMRGSVTSMTAEQFNVHEENNTMALEGNVRFAFDDTLITASRAVVRMEPDGSTTLQIDDATVVRSDKDATPSSE
jgi:hypothetical protein